MPTTYSRTTNKPASDAQLRFLNTLLEQHTPNPDLLDLLSHIATRRLTGSFVAARLVSEAIDGVKGSPWKPRNERPVTDAELPPVRLISEVDLSNVPAGRYAIPNNPSRLKVQIDKPTEGRWAGWTFVKDGADYGFQRKYGAARPGERYRGDITDELSIIASMPRACAAEYGRITSHCGLCGRKLEDAESVARGIGPVCAGKAGW